MKKVFLSAICVLLASTGIVFAQGNIQNAAGSAWVECDEDGDCTGWVFSANKKLSMVVSEDNGKTWTSGSSGTWSTSGSKLEINVPAPVGKMTVTYSVSGNTLTTKSEDGSETQTYQKKTGLKY